MSDVENAEWFLESKSAVRQFKLKIVDTSDKATSCFLVMEAEEGSDEWLKLEDYPSRMECESFIDGYTFK